MTVDELPEYLKQHGLEIGVEKRSAELGELVIQLLGRGERREIGVRRCECALFLGSEGGFLKILEGERRKEFLRGFLVVIAAIGPEELGHMG